MATVNAQGPAREPHAGVRGSSNETSQLTFATDLRSPKTSQLAQSPWAELCWYFPVYARAISDRRSDRGGRAPGKPTTCLAAARRDAWRCCRRRHESPSPGPHQGRLAIKMFPFRPMHPDAPRRRSRILACSCSIPIPVDFLESPGTHKTAGSSSATKRASGPALRSTRETNPWGDLPVIVLVRTPLRLSGDRDRCLHQRRIPGASVPAQSAVSLMTPREAWSFDNGSEFPGARGGLQRRTPRWSRRRALLEAGWRLHEGR